MSEPSANKLLKPKKGEILFKEGDAGYKIYIIKEGAVRITTQKDDKLVTLGVLTKGACFGEMAVISSAPRVATAAADADSEIFEIDKSHVDKMIEELPPLFRAIVNSLIKRVASLNNFATEKSSLGHPLSSLAHLIILLNSSTNNSGNETTGTSSSGSSSGGNPSWARQPDPTPETTTSVEFIEIPVQRIIDNSQTILGFTKGNTERLLNQFNKFNLARIESRGSQKVLCFNEKSFIEDTDKTLASLGHMIDNELRADIEYVDLLEMATQMKTTPRYLIDAISSGRLPPEAIVLKQSLVRRAIEDYGRMFF